MPDADDYRFMARALELARRGEGRVEPNPMVGCVLVRDGVVVGEGWHEQFGGPHAEVNAIAAAGEAARGATAYVTLEPCCHTGKTPPCTKALIAAGVSRVVAGLVDPNWRVNGGGLAELAAAGITVETGLLAEDTAELIAPFAKFMTHHRPWVIAKWAMTLDGKLATREGNSQWISGEESRAIVHQLRGRVNATIVGRGTAHSDDPLLTARPPGARVATRIVLDSSASLPLVSQLVATAREAPVLVVASAEAPPENVAALRSAGVEVWSPSASDRAGCAGALLDELGRRQMTNILIEGGGEVFGEFFDLGVVDEVHVFVAPKIVGGPAPTPVAGSGVAWMVDALRLATTTIEQAGDDAYIHGRIAR